MILNWGEMMVAKCGDVATTRNGPVQRGEVKCWGTSDRSLTKHPGKNGLIVVGGRLGEIVRVVG